MVPCTKLFIQFPSKNIKLTILIVLILGYIYFYQSIPSHKSKSGQLSSPLILLYTHNRSVKTKNNICQGARNGKHVVNFDKCPRKCQFSCRIEDYKFSPLAVLFFSEDFFWSFKLTNQDRSSFKQRWIFWSWEAPIHHQEYVRSGLTFNWTMTYRQDSDIVHAYGRYIQRNLSYTIRDYQSVDYYLSSKDNQSTFNIQNEFQSRKNKIVWFVSNCRARSIRRKLAEEIKTYFPIDQYGQCSKSDKSKTQMSSKDFEQTLFKYKFYLAFENAHCQDYITEKVFYNALAHGSIPIVFGADYTNYQKILPPNSFIYVDKFSNFKNLSDKLHHISENYKAFESYHQWRSDYRLITWPSNYYIDDLFCSLCMKLYEDKSEKSYNNLSNWLNKCN